MKKIGFISVNLFILLILVAACSGVDCPLNNVVYTRYAMKVDIGTKDVPEIVPDMIEDTISVWTKRADGQDSILNINLDSKVESFKIPISYVNEKDTLVIYRLNRSRNIDTDILDTVWVSKTNTPHFESVDCAPNYFHEITDVRYTHNGIDSLTINSKTVDYEARDNFYIFFKHIKQNK